MRLIDEHYLATLFYGVIARVKTGHRLRVKTGQGFDELELLFLGFPAFF